MSKWVVAVLWALLTAPIWASAANINNFSLGLRQTGTLVGTLWSTLGVVADSTTDNTAALNALNPATHPSIIADCPGGGTIRFASTWLLKSNLVIRGLNNCPMLADFVNTGNTGAITQASTAAPLTNVTLSGLVINKVKEGRLFITYINGHTFTNNIINTQYGFLFSFGADQEWGHNHVTTDISQPFDGPGLRLFGNGIGGGACPEAATTGGKPANVWVHNNSITSHDGTYQVAPAITGNGVKSSCNYLFENNNAFGAAGRAYYLANGVWPMSDITFRGNRGAAVADFIRIAHDETGSSGIGGGISNITIEDNVGSGSAQTGQFTFLHIDPMRGPVSNVTVTNNVFDAPRARIVRIEAPTLSSVANTTGINISGLTTGTPRAASLPAIQIDKTDNFTLNASAVASRADGVVICSGGGACLNPTITGNTLSNIRNGYFGIDVTNATGGTITGNTVTRAASGGSTSSGGMSFSSGVSDLTATGNTVSSPIIPLVCPPAGQGNTISGNTGASDCP